MVHAAFDPAELRALFGPAFVADVVDDAVWNATHGVAKRGAVWTGDDRRAIVVTAALRTTSAQGDG